MKLMRSILTHIVAPLLFLLVSYPSGAEANPRLIPDPTIAAVGRMGEPLPVDTLIKTALRVSGATEGEIGSGSAVLMRLLADAENEVDRNVDLAESAEKLLEFLHNNILTVYDEYQTRVDVAVKTGRFNCVSSAVLYMIFVRFFDIPVIGVGTVDHAFCAVVLPDRSIDVETTTVHGFDPGRKSEFHDSFGNVTGYAYVPPSDYSRRDDLGEKELLALILKNRISVLESQRKYGEAVALAVDRYALAPGDFAHLTGEMVNFAALLNEKKEYARAIDFLTEVTARYGWAESFRRIYEILYYNNSVALIEAGRPREAADTIDLASRAGWITADAARTLRNQVGERILKVELPLLTSQQSLDLVNDLLSKGLLTEQRHTDFAIMFFSRLADGEALEGHYLSASEVIDTAIAALGPDPRLSGARTAYRYNYAVEVHNVFASMFNGKEYQEAREHLLMALEQVPESDILKEDLATVRRAIAAGD